jgi:hypothetical protein
MMNNEYRMSNDVPVSLSFTSTLNIQHSIFIIHRGYAFVCIAFFVNPAYSFFLKKYIHETCCLPS